MRLLVLGGSWFVGRAVVAAALARGHNLTVFNRGRSRQPVPEGVTAIHGDRENQDDLRRLSSSGPWDAVIDVPGGYPTVVRDSARALANAAMIYVFVSTVSVYRDWPSKPVDESSPLHESDPDFDPGWRRRVAGTYGPLKAGCEMAIRREFGNQTLILRPGVVLGPHEYVGRVEWWLNRMRRGGLVLAPGSPDRLIQPIDVRDLAAFLIDQVEQGGLGVYNVAAPPQRETYGGFLEACRNVTGSEAEIAWVDEGFLVTQDVKQWTELPLWRVAPGTWAMNPARAENAGLVCRPLSDTVADTWNWLRSGGVAVEHERHSEQGIDPERERDLLARWESRLRS